MTTLKGIRTIIDTGHNEAGMRYNIKQLLQEKYRHLHFVIGMVKDKDIDHVLRLLPSHAFYHFVKADIPRGLEADQLKAMAEKYQLKGKSYNHVAEGALVALSQCSSDDLLFIGGSNFVVAEIIPMLEEDCPFHS